MGRITSIASGDSNEVLRCLDLGGHLAVSTAGLSLGNPAIGFDHCTLCRLQCRGQCCSPQRGCGRLLDPHAQCLARLRSLRWWRLRLRQNARH